MDQETLVPILIFIGAVIVAVIWALDRTNQRVADAVPPDVMAILQVAVGALQTLAERSPSTLDDEVVKLLKTLIEGKQPPAEPPAAG